MKKNEIYEGVVSRVDFPNKGIVMVEDTPCVIKNVIPGQTIEFAISKKRSGHAEGRLLRILNPSPCEIESPCPHFGKCGGCTYINMPYEEELKLKESQIKRLLDNALQNQEEEWEYLPIVPSPEPYDYRNKMEFSFGDEYKGGPLALGMHKRGSFYDIETVSGCRIADSDFRNILTFTLEYFQEVPFLHKQSHEGFLRHLLIRKAKSSEEIMVCLVTTSTVPSEEIMKGRSVEDWKDKLLSADFISGKLTGIMHIVNDSLADVVQADELKVLYGRDYITENILGLKFNISVFSFFQTNSKGAEALYDTARRFISESGEHKIVYDLYSGTGTIAQLLAPVSEHVYGVEIVEEAVVKARENAERNGLNNCTFIAGDVLKELENIPERPDFIVLDPPRDGVHPKALTTIINYGVDNLIYISCKPTSLARDLESFLLAGYRVVKACAVDQFPWTANVETICLLSREIGRHTKDYIKVGIDAEEYYKIKNEG